MLTLDIQTIRPVRPPARSHPEDAGIDFFVPEGPPRTIAGPGNLIPLGVAVAVPPGHALVLKDRSGNAAKRGLRVVAGVIDPGYRGEVSALIDVAPGTIVTINAGERICQGLLVPIPEVEVREVASLPDSGRGSGGFGSTGV